MLAIAASFAVFFSPPRARKRIQRCVHERERIGAAPSLYHTARTRGCGAATPHVPVRRNFRGISRADTLSTRRICEHRHPFVPLLSNGGASFTGYYFCLVPVGCFLCCVPALAN